MSPRVVVVIGPAPSSGNTKPVRRRTNGLVVVPPSFGAPACAGALSCPAVSGGPDRLACDLLPLAPGRAPSPGPALSWGRLRGTPHGHCRTRSVSPRRPAPGRRGSVGERAAHRRSTRAAQRDDQRPVGVLDRGRG